MAHRIRFELMTLALEGRCSIQLSYRVIKSTDLTIYATINQSQCVTCVCNTGATCVVLTCDITVSYIHPRPLLYKYSLTPSRYLFPFLKNQLKLLLNHNSTFESTDISRSCDYTLVFKGRYDKVFNRYAKR